MLVSAPAAPVAIVDPVSVPRETAPAVSETVTAAAAMVAATQETRRVEPPSAVPVATLADPSSPQQAVPQPAPPQASADAARTDLGGALLPAHAEPAPIDALGTSLAVKLAFYGVLVVLLILACRNRPRYPAFA